MWQLSFPYTEEAARSLCKDPTALKSEILRRCAKWHEPIPELLRSTPLDGMAGYPVYDREVLQPDVLRPGSSAAATGAAAASTPAAQRRVTLIGDAAHPMTPFKAQGANQALSDAVLLADTLVESIQRHGPHAGLDAALPLFEQTMLSRSVRVATEHGQMPAHLSHGQTPAHLGSARARPRLLPSARLVALGGPPLSGQRGRYRATGRAATASGASSSPPPKSPIPLPLPMQVVGSREKAKEMHSSLALQPSRKVQREADPGPDPSPSPNLNPNPDPNPSPNPKPNQVQRGGEAGVDMQHVIRTLRAKGVGAHCATTPRGLDAVVAEAIELCDASAPAHATPIESAPVSIPVSVPEGSLLSARAMGLSASRQLVRAPAESRKRRGEADSAAGREVKKSRGQGALLDGCGDGEKGSGGGGGGGGGGKGMSIEAEVFGICTRNATRTSRGTMLLVSSAGSTCQCRRGGRLSRSDLRRRAALLCWQVACSRTQWDHSLPTGRR